MNLKNISTYLLLMFVVCFPTTEMFAVNINPSKSQGGSTNNTPYKSDLSSPSLLKNPLRWMFGPDRSAAMQRVLAPPNFKVQLVTEPNSFDPSKDKQLKAKMVVINQDKSKYILQFDTAQKYEFIIQNKEKKEMYRSSGDKDYSQQLSSIVLNKGEKIIYEEEIVTATQNPFQLPPGEYKLIGQITAKTPISVETDFRVSSNP
jgi:hypothetical protein